MKKLNLMEKVEIISGFIAGMLVGMVIGASAVGVMLGM